MESRPALTRPLRTVVIGSGNVATRLAPALEASGAIAVEAVWSRTAAHAEALASRLGSARAVTDMAALPTDAEFYLVAVVDDQLPSVVEAMKPNGALWAHTSGTVDAAVLAPLTENYGVFYPLQTLSRDVDIDLREAPFFIEGSTPQTVDVLSRMARTISDRVYEADSQLRGRLHAAAVFACNFANHLWAVADDLLRREAGLDIKVLEPLMRETLRKALTVRPADGQTGPAMRGDRGVMERHTALMSEREAELYRVLSDSIMQYHNVK